MGWYTIEREKCNICTTNVIGEEYHYLSSCDLLWVTESCIWNHNFMLTLIYAGIWRFFFTSTNKSTLIKRSFNFQFFFNHPVKVLTADCFLQMTKTKHIPSYMKLNLISTIGKCHFSAVICWFWTYCRCNTIVLYSTLCQCIMSMSCVLCMRLSLSPPVRVLIYIVMNKVVLCYVQYCRFCVCLDVPTYLLLTIWPPIRCRSGFNSLSGTLTIWRPETPKWVLLQTVKSQMK